MAILSDAEINDLIGEVKTIPDGLMPVTRFVGRNHHKRKEYDVISASGNQFVIHLRQSELNALDFSAILGYRPAQVHTVFRLRRYNGRHQHTNVLEKRTFYDFHIHTATRRYQAPGFREDHFAATTNRYVDLDGAIRCLVMDCGFLTFEDTPLFREDQ